MNNLSKIALLLLMLFLLFGAASAFSPSNAEQKLKHGLLERALAARSIETSGHTSAVEKVLVQVSSEQKTQEVSDKIQSLGAQNTLKKIGKTIIAEMPLARLLETADMNGVESIWPDLEVSAMDEGALQQINAKQSWDLSYKGDGIKIAVLDTGIDETHPALVEKVVASANFSGSATTSDLQGHGTHVAGIISGYGDTNGVAANAQLLNAKVLNDSGSGTISSVIEGISWAVEQGANVINLSLGATTHENNTPLNQAVRDAIAQGVIVVIASGNCGECGNCNGFTGVTMPGNTKEALTVGAVDSTNAHACFSSGETLAEEIKPDVVAPGVGIVSSLPNNSLGTKSGTSMATPFAAGTIALFLQKNHGLTPYQAKKWLEINSLDLGATGKDNLFGSGLLDAYKIVSTDFSGVPDENAIIPPDENRVDFNIGNLGFSFTGPSVLNKKQAGTFTVETQTSGNALGVLELQKDATVEFVVFDEFGNPVDRKAVGPLYLTEFIPGVFNYDWNSERTGNFTIQAIAYVEGQETGVFSNEQNIKTATAEKNVRVTVPNDLVSIQNFSVPETIQKGGTASFSVDLQANNLLQSLSAEDFSYRAQIQICANTDLSAGQLIWLKNINFSQMQVQSDLRDVRVFNAETGTELQRKIEGTGTSTDGNVFFAIDNPIANGNCINTTYYLYYSNASANEPLNSAQNLDDFTNYASGTTTPFGNWFEDSGLTKGTIVDDTMDAQHAHSIHNSMLILGITNIITDYNQNSPTPSFDTNLRGRTWDYNAWIYPGDSTTAQSNQIILVDFNADHSTFAVGVNLEWNGTNFRYYNSVTSWTNLTSSYDKNQWHKIQITYTWLNPNYRVCIYAGTATNLISTTGCTSTINSGDYGRPILPDSWRFSTNGATTPFWVDDIGFFAPYETNISLGAAETLGEPEPQSSDVNAFVSVFLRDETDSIVGFYGSEEKNLLKDANNLFEFDEPINLPAGDYNLEAVVFFEDQNISIKKPLKISAEGFTGIESLNIPTQAEIGSIVPVKVRVKNNSSMEISPMVFLQASNEGELVSSKADFNKTIQAGETQEFLFDWNASAKASLYDLNAIVMLDNTTQSSSGQIQIIDSTAPQIKSMEFSSSVKQDSFNPITVVAKDYSEIASATVSVIDPIHVSQKILLKKQEKDSNGQSFSGAIALVHRPGKYFLKATVCDEFNNCADSPLKSFTVLKQPDNCFGKTVLVVLDNDNFSLESSGQEWTKDLNVPGYCFSRWETKKFGATSFWFLHGFSAVIWSTGNNFGYAIDANDAQALQSLASASIKLLVEGSDIASEHAFDSFSQNVLHAEFLKEQDSNVPNQLAVFRRDIFKTTPSALGFDYNSAPYADSVKPLGTAFAVAGWDSNNSAVIAWEDSSKPVKTIFAPFSFDALEKTEQQKVLADSLEWLFAKTIVPP